MKTQIKSFPNLRKFSHEEAAELYKQGLSTTQIANKFGVTSRTVLTAIKKQGVETRSFSDSVSLRKRGNKRLDSGYITVCSGKYERKKEHILIAESVIGRKLNKNEHVHHINGIKTDNRKCNLLICTRSYHIALHHRMKKHPYWSKLNEQ